MKKLVALLLCLGLLGMLSGCMGKGVELKELTVIQGIGVDKEEDEINVSLQVFDAAKASGNANELSGNLTKVLESKGKSIYDAIYKSATLIGGEPFASQNRMIVFGEKLAKSGIKSHMDYFFRDHETRLNVTVAICKGDAKEILSADCDEALIPIEKVENLIKTSESNLITPHTDVFSVIKPIHELEGDYYITALKVEKEKKDGEEKKKVVTDGVGIFKGNQLAGYLGQEESKGLIWLNGKVDNGIIIVDYPSVGQISAEILNCNTKLSIQYDGDTPVGIVTVDCTLSVDEIQGGTDENFTLKTIAPIQQVINENIAETISQTISRCVYDYNVDVFRLRDIMKKTYPQKFKSVENQWHDFIKTMEFRMQINSQITRIGEEAIHK